MLTKEYRVPLPLTLEEYRIAQLYMIQKKSRLESTGAGSGVEILQNEPYDNGPGGSGQYTKKIYHIGSHLPGWLKSLLPKTALCVEEEAWNAYPYTKTRHTCPFIEKFFIDIETHYLGDYGQTENVFNLPTNERKKVEVDLVDPIADPFPPKDYEKEEDPLLFISKKTGRGPLAADWLKQYTSGKSNGSIMCAYKLIRVEFKYWGMQSRIEQFIHGGLRNPVLVGHRQAWAWQDEWHGMTIDDIRRLELQAQNELSKKMGEFTGESTTEISTPPEVCDHDCGLLMADTQSKESESEDDEDDDEMFFDALDKLSEEEFPMKSKTRSLTSLSLDYAPTYRSTHIVLFVVHAGSIEGSAIDLNEKWREFEMLETVFTNVCETYYPDCRDKFNMKLIDCPNLSTEIILGLKKMNINSKSEDETLPNSLLFAAVPNLITELPSFQPTVNTLVNNVNKKYQKVVEKLPADTDLEVYMIGDCIGGLLLYQSLCALPCRSSTSSISTDDGQEIPIPAVNLEQDSLSDGRSMVYEFDVNGVFLFGSPVGLLAYKEMVVNKKLTAPICGQIYNLFHSLDPLSCRLEPLFNDAFNKTPPASIPQSHMFPYTMDMQRINCHSEDRSVNLRKVSTFSAASNLRRSEVYAGRSLSDTWWGNKRVDYMLFCPEEVQQLPASTLHHLCYNNYWESKDLATFILWQILDENLGIEKQVPADLEDFFAKDNTTEKWLRRGTKLKIKKMNPNHQANDVIVVESAQAYISAKFTYGPVDIATLAGEKVDLYIAKRPQLSEWRLLDTDLTDNHGRYLHTMHSNDIGVHSLRMVVRGDHSLVECNLAIVPPKTEAVVFSIDGSFLASYSIRGRNPKIRGGAVDVVRHWQELGYLIIYVSSRLLFQKYQVMTWLSEHNFPFGIVSFCEHVSTDFQKYKIDFLKNVIKLEQVTIHAVYGSSRDTSVYLSALHLPSSRVFLVSKKRKDDNAQWITNGYKAHLSELKQSPLSCRSVHNKNLFLSLGTFRNKATQKRSLCKLISEPLDNARKPQKRNQPLLRGIRSFSKKHSKNNSK